MRTCANTINRGVKVFKVIASVVICPSPVTSQLFSFARTSPTARQIEVREVGNMVAPYINCKTRRKAGDKNGEPVNFAANRRRSHAEARGSEQQFYLGFDSLRNLMAASEAPRHGESHGGHHKKN